ncbi:MAG: biotin/lipoate A/B protein ligase family protein [Halobacteriales archaeon]
MTDDEPDEAPTPADEHAAVRRAFDATRNDGERRVRVWRPARQVAFGRRDTNSSAYDEARKTAREAGYATTVRNVGGRAVVHAGETVAFAVAAPVEDPRVGLRDRYDDAVCATRDALESVGVDAGCGEPDDSFCPGEASLCVDGGKVAGVAQRVARDAALVSGVVVTGRGDETARVLSSVYGALGVPFDTSSVGTADASPSAVAYALQDSLDGL